MKNQPPDSLFSPLPAQELRKKKSEHMMSQDNLSSKMLPAANDELLASLGYKVKSSSLTVVVQKIDQLEQVMDGVQLDGVSQTVHYNPSDLSSYLESVMSGLSPLPEFEPYSDPFLESSISSSRMLSELDFGSDLITIPGKAIYPHSPPPPQAKKLKTSTYLGENEWAPVEPLLVVERQENGIRLVHTLKACAQAVQQQNFKLAEALLKNIGFLAVTQAGAMRKVATYFAEALARRIYKLYPTNPQETSFTDLLEMHFYETCPYLKFAHFTANQAILQAFAGKTRVHVIDFSMKQGMQWPALLQALASTPHGPPSFRLTGIGPPSPGNADNLQEVGSRLAQLAESINVEFEYKGFVANSLAELDSSMFDVRESETVAVNSISELHQLLATPGAIEKVLSVVKELKPEILTVVEQEANHNGNVFLDRFNESLHYYSTIFDSLESRGADGGDGSVSNQDKVMTEVYLGRQICNVVACEGVDRVERHEALGQWRARFESCGFGLVRLGWNAFKQAKDLLALFAGVDGYMVEESDGCLMLGWHARPLIATSAWKLG